jgi:hypothetical protein
MAEETAGVIICCMPSTAIVFKSVKGPVASWLSSKAQRLTGSYRSGDGKTMGSGGNPNHAHLSVRRFPGVAIKNEFDTYSLEQLNPSNSGVVKKMEFSVSQSV